jgi:hypothetical protein
MDKGEISNEKNLAETCRLALEKSYGMQIPVPNCLARKERRF